MTVMYSFCLWFPVRVGSIIVAITCMVESLVCLIPTIVGLQNPAESSNRARSLLNEYDLIVATPFFESLRDNPTPFLQGFVSAMTAHLCASLLLLLGCFKCRLWLIYPFVGIEFLRLIALSIAFIILLLIIKTNTLTLGIVIGGSIFGGFSMLYLWYQWFCVVSLCQIIKEVSKMEKKQNLSRMNFGGKIGLLTDSSPFYTKSTIAGNLRKKPGYFDLPISS